MMMSVVLLAVEERAAAKLAARSLRSLELSASQLAHLDLLLNGYYCGVQACPAVQQGYPASANWVDFISNDRPFPAFDVALDFGRSLQLGDRIALRDGEGSLLAILTVGWIGQPFVEGQGGDHVSDVITSSQTVLLPIAGHIEGIETPVHYDFPSLRLSASELRGRLQRMGQKRILACQPAGLIHRAEAVRISHAARETQAGILVQLLARNEEVICPEHYLRVRAIGHSLRYLSDHDSAMAVLPQPKLAKGSEGIFWRALVARNAGATHILMEPDWWHGVEAEDHERVRQTIRQIGIEPVEAPLYTYDETLKAYVPTSSEPSYAVHASGSSIENVMADGEKAPWQTFPEVLTELCRNHRVRSRQGATIFFTGLSGAGKSTIARALLARMLENGERTVTLLDGDVVRKNLSSELGFSRHHRDLNILRIGFVASEITKHGGIAICAPIAPYRETRRMVRRMVEQVGCFVEVFVATPLEVCEARDRKGLYAKARAGLIKEFTGISDPYETPESPELVIDTREVAPLEAVQMIVAWLKREGLLMAEQSGALCPALDIPPSEPQR